LLKSSLTVCRGIWPARSPKCAAKALATRAVAVVSVGYELGHPGHAGHVHVVAAGVIDGHLVASGVPDGDGAGVGRAGVLPQRQRVEFAAQQDGRPGAVGQHAGHSGAADAGLDRQAIALQPLGDAPGGVVLLV